MQLRLCVHDLGTGSQRDPAWGIGREGFPGSVEAVHAPPPLMGAGGV